MQYLSISNQFYKQFTADALKLHHTVFAHKKYLSLKVLIPLQIVPLPVKPSKHSQSYDPGISVHEAFMWHSDTSVQSIMSKMKKGWR